MKFLMLSLNCPHAKKGQLHASEFSSHEISFYNYWAFLKTGINLQNLPPAHSRGAATFSGLWQGHTYGFSHRTN